MHFFRIKIKRHRKRNRSSDLTDQEQSASDNRQTIWQTLPFVPKVSFIDSHENREYHRD